MKRLNRSAFDSLKGNVVERWRQIRTSNHSFVRDLFEAGHSANSIGKQLKISRTMVKTILEELNIPIPDISEGNRRSAAMLTDDARKARASAAHEAIRKIGRHSPTQTQHSVRKQVSGDYIGVGETELGEQLISAGLKPIPQAAFEGYNIDLLCDHLAVEVHNYTTRPTDKTQILTRIIKILSGGISIIYVRTGPNFPMITDAAVNQVVAFYNHTRKNPSSIGQYRVIRGDGKVDWTAERHLDHLAGIVASYCTLKSGSKD